MTYKTLRSAGWLAMASAFASIPVAYLAYSLEGRIDTIATSLQAAIQLVGVVLFVAITLYLKKLLNAYCNFHGTDRNIDWMIKANVTAAILTLLALYSGQLKETLGMAALAIIMVQGVIQIQFGYRLLRLQDNLGGMLKPFCYANMATGLCVVSVVLFLVGVVISAISDLMLGTIFFHIARKVKVYEQ